MRQKGTSLCGPHLVAVSQICSYSLMIQHDPTFFISWVGSYHEIHRLTQLLQHPNDTCIMCGREICYLMNGASSILIKCVVFKMLKLSNFISILKCFKETFKGKFPFKSSKTIQRTKHSLSFSILLYSMKGETNRTKFILVLIRTIIDTRVIDDLARQLNK